MSLKNIEMQVAVPRTQDLGKIQSEMMERASVMNSMANAVVQKEEERKRTSVVHKDELQKAMWKKEGGASGHVEEKGGHEMDADRPRHPFKGKFIDFSG